jgi:hypothetical protein
MFLCRHVGYSWCLQCIFALLEPGRASDCFHWGTACNGYFLLSQMRPLFVSIVMSEAAIVSVRFIDLKSMNFHTFFLFQRADGWWDWGGALGHSLTASESEWPPSGSFVAHYNFRTFVLIATRPIGSRAYLGSLSMVEHTDEEYPERLELHTRLLFRVIQPVSWQICRRL